MESLRYVRGACIDAFSWLIAVPLAFALREDFFVTGITIRNAVAIGLLLGALQVAIGISFKFYMGRYRDASLDQAVSLALSAFAIGIGSTIFLQIVKVPGVPRSVGILSSAIALIFMLSARSIPRLIHDYWVRSKSSERVLIFGAGDIGIALVRQMLSDPSNALHPIGFLDDSPTKRHFRYSNVKVLGGVDELEVVVEGKKVDVVVMAQARPTRDQISRLDRRVRNAGATLRLMPTLVEPMGIDVSIDSLSNSGVEDIIGRQPFQSDEERIQDLLTGKRILVTGAGGSIGSELARQVFAYQPAALAFLDRDESALLAVQLSINGQGLLTDPNLFLADVRDADRIRDIMLSFRPEIVFHAAALKHLTLLEAHRGEAWKTNIEGTSNVLTAAAEAGCSIAINVSTDKAADPVSVLGLSKLITERLTAEICSGSGLRFMSVRFGNVLGSRGSVLDTFRAQIARGGPVTLTDREVTRYFMTIPEAVHLVLEAATVGRGGETLVLDMGKPIKILDVAQLLIQEAGKTIDIEITGLRQGEKLHEQLVSPDERAVVGIHPKIMHLRVAPMDIVEAWEVWNV